jgi:hypothetical protein
MVRKTMWNPTLRKGSEGWGAHVLVNYRKSGKGGPPDYLTVELEPAICK